MSLRCHRQLRRAVFSRVLTLASLKEARATVASPDLLRRATPLSPLMPIVADDLWSLSLASLALSEALEADMRVQIAAGTPSCYRAIQLS